MKKGTKVVRIISGAGVRTASVGVVESVKKGVVRLVGDSSLAYRLDTGQEIDPAIPGFYSEIIVMEE